MINPPPEKIMFFYGEYQDLFMEYPEVEFVEGLPTMSQFDGRQRTLVILDDLLSQTNSNVEQIFTKGSHHRDLSVIFLSQNLFHQNKHNRTLSLNAHYIVVFKAPRDATQIVTLSKQMYPGKSRFLVESYNDATRKAYGYLFIDLRGETPDEYRIRANIFPTDARQYAYVPK
jgi:hypothetical protein